MDIKKRAMIDALEKSLGIVTTAVKIIGIGRTQHYQWMKEDEEYKKAVEDVGDIALDFAESKLHKQIENGDTTACIFYLKTKGKKRGYIEQHNISAQIEELKAPSWFINQDHIMTTNGVVKES